MLSPIRTTYSPTENLHKSSWPIGTSLSEYMGIPLYLKGHETLVNNKFSLQQLPTVFYFSTDSRHSRNHVWVHRTLTLGRTHTLLRVPRSRPCRERCRAATSLRGMWGAAPSVITAAVEPLLLFRHEPAPMRVSQSSKLMMSRPLLPCTDAVAAPSHPSWDELRWLHLLMMMTISPLTSLSVLTSVHQDFPLMMTREKAPNWSLCRKLIKTNDISERTDSSHLSTALVSHGIVWPPVRAVSHDMPGLPSVAKYPPNISAIPVLSPTHEVEGRDVSVETCNKNQQHHPTVSGNERYKRHAGVTHYTSPTVVAPSVMPCIVATDATRLQDRMHAQPISLTAKRQVAVSPHWVEICLIAT